MLVFTSCVNNYLPKARVLADSLKKFHPDWHFAILLGERPPADFDLESEPFDRVVGFSELGITDYPAWSFNHDIVELCTAVKGFALNYFLEEEEVDKVIYLDPDIMVLESLAPLSEKLDRVDILLTPHQLAPQTDYRAIVDNEISSLRHGIFNLGFAGCANRQQGIAFSRFWRDRLADWCFDDKENGLFTDQKWCDLVPAYFTSLEIIRDPGYNAASWNLTDRKIRKDAKGRFLANDKLLRFYHFTGYDSGMGRVMSSIYGSKMPAVEELWQIYEKKLAENQKGENRHWAGNFFSNGVPIPVKARKYYRANPELQTKYPDPYLTNAEGSDGFAGYWRRHELLENNLFYVWARKPFRLAWLMNLYLRRHGGLAAMPMLMRKVRDIWRQDGINGVVEKIRKFKHQVSRDGLSLGQILASSSQWSKMLAEKFTGSNSVLILDHMYGGGANEYRRKRIDNFLAQGSSVLLLLWDFFGNSLKCEFYWPDGEPLKVVASDLGEVVASPLHFERILVNELVLWSLANEKRNHYAALPSLIDKILQLKNKDNAILEVAIHDFYPVCPSYYLLENGEKYCGIPEDAERCRRCLSVSVFNVPGEFNLHDWRIQWKRLLEQAGEVRTFSHAAAEILAIGLNFPKDNIAVLPHEPLSSLRTPVLPCDNRPMRIGIVGHIAYHKGSGIIRELAALLDENESIVVIGELEDSAALPANITTTGAYQRADLPDLLEREAVTCVLVPSVWPETFCYVLQECMQMQMPLVVFPLGAQEERVKDYEWGIVASEVSANGALKALRELHRHFRTDS